MVNVDGFSIAAAAAEFGVGWHTAQAAVAEYTDPVVDDPARLDGVVGIGVDEKRFLNATAEHRTVFTTQIVDLDRHRLLDVIEGRSRDVLASWLAARGPDWCNRITLATLDPAAGYRAALVERLPNAVRVVDHFHAIKLANSAIDDTRRRVQQTTMQHRGHKGDPLYRGRRVFLTGFERLSPERIAWMFELLAQGDPDGEVGATILAKELLREVYASVDLAARTATADLVLPTLRRCRHPRADPPRQDHRPLARRGPRLPPHQPSFERPRRERPHARREDPPQRPRIRQPHPLPPPTHRLPRHQMDYHPHSQNPRPPTTLSRVEPQKGG